MNVRNTCPGGRIDVFDTSAYVASAPFDGKNMLMEFESAALMRIEASNDGVLERIAKLRAFMALETKEGAPAIPEVPAEVVKYALSTIATQPGRDDMRVVSEDWGDMDEVGW